MESYIKNIKKEDFYYDGPVRDSGRTMEEIDESIEREKKLMEEMAQKYTQEQIIEMYHKAGIY